MNEKTRLKLERKFQKQNANAAAAQCCGTDQFIFENATKGELRLSRPTATGRKSVAPGEQFIGDNYYFNLVKTHELRFIDNVKNDDLQLITEVPPTVTQEKGPVKCCAEKRNLNSEEEMLLTESPIDGIKII